MATCLLHHVWVADLSADYCISNVESDDPGVSFEVLFCDLISGASTISDVHTSNTLWSSDCMGMRRLLPVGNTKNEYIKWFSDRRPRKSCSPFEIGTGYTKRLCGLFSTHLVQMV